jgi:hypothetical protein
MDVLSNFCDVRWLTKADMLKRAYVLLNEIKLFLEMKNKIAAELDDKEGILYL